LKHLPGSLVPRSRVYSPAPVQSTLAFGREVFVINRYQVDTLKRALFDFQEKFRVSFSFRVMFEWRRSQYVVIQRAITQQEEWDLMRCFWDLGYGVPFVGHRDTATLIYVMTDNVSSILV